MWPAARLVALAASVACTATQPVRVLPMGQTRWIASVGGPVLPQHVPTKIVPYTDIGMMWGKTDNLTLTANVHVLAAAFGIAGVDVGAARRLLAQQGARPEITGQAQVYLFDGDGGARVYPNVTTTASWTAGPRTLLYGGVSLVGQFSGTPGMIVTPLAGVQRQVSQRLTLQLEGKWMAANADMHSGLFQGESSISGHGGLAAQIGLQVNR
jgi:hypothetical protein